MNLTLQEHVAKWRSCTRCGLSKHAWNLVFHRGSNHPIVTFIGEGPGRTEDRQGQPFVGRAGSVLDAMIERAGLPPDSYSITNLVSCRPCNSKYSHNRAPKEQEVSACAARLNEYLQIVRPSAVVTLGRVTEKMVNEVVGIVGVPILGLLHPTYILRTGGEKSKTFDDHVRKLQEFWHAIESKKEDA